MKAAQTPLVELLRDIPRTERLVIDEGNYTTHHIPVGIHCHDAADLIEAQAKEINALKSLANAPIAKVEVTDEMCNIVDKIVLERGGVTNKTTARIALETVFFMQEPKDISMSSGFDCGCEHSLYGHNTGGEAKFCKDHIPPLLAERLIFWELTAPSEKEIISDGWVEWAGGYPPVSADTLVDVKYNCNQVPACWTQGIQKASAYTWSHGWGISDIIAYRIISEPEEEKMECDVCESATIKGMKEGMKAICKWCEEAIREEKKEPKKQTLIEFMDNKIGYKGEILPKAAFERRQVYVNMSEYLELNK